MYGRESPREQTSTPHARTSQGPGRSTTVRVHEESCSTSCTDEDGSTSATNEDVTCAHTANGGHDRAASDTEGPRFLSTSAECTIQYAIARANGLIDELESLDLTRRFCFLVRCLRFAFDTCFNVVFPGEMSVHGSALKQPELSESGVNRVQEAMRDARDVMATIERDDPENGFDYTLQRLGHAVEAIEEQIQAQLRR